MKKKGIAIKIARYISRIFAIVFIIFAWVYLFYAFVEYMINFKELNFFKTLGKSFGTFFLCCVFGSIQLSLVTLRKSAPNLVTEERESQL